MQISKELIKRRQLNDFNKSDRMTEFLIHNINKLVIIMCIEFTFKVSLTKKFTKSTYQR